MAHEVTSVAIEVALAIEDREFSLPWQATFIVIASKLVRCDARDLNGAIVLAKMRAPHSLLAPRIRRSFHEYISSGVQQSPPPRGLLRVEISTLSNGVSVRLRSLTSPPAEHPGVAGTGASMP